MKHQIEGLRLLDENPSYYALACEQGTGKTWMVLADAERKFLNQEITGLLVIAPKGVHTNWVRREAPTHLSIAFDAARYRAGAGKGERKSWETLVAPRVGALTIFAINIDALRTPCAFKLAQQFVSQHRCMMVVDESSDIKGFDAARTKKCLNLSRWAESRRILDGTLGSAGPQDLFSQFEFLSPGLLGTTSYRAFVSEYCVLLPRSSHIVQDVIRRAGPRGQHMNPMIVARDREGRPRYKNLDRLHEVIAPYMFRIKKEDCLDLPPKVFHNEYFELKREQRTAYSDMLNEQRYYDEEGNVDTVTALASLNKLRQITSGFIMREGEPEFIGKDNPRVDALDSLLGRIEWPAIIWANYRAELSYLEEKLAEDGYRCVTYHGGTSDTDREEAVDAFQDGAADIFLGNPQAAGVGLTLHRAKSVIYYSNDFKLRVRLQSEDRAHRKGTEHTVNYYDIVATDTRDEQITAALQYKQEVLAMILGDQAAASQGS